MRWESVDGLPGFYRSLLEQRGFGFELSPTRKRPAKISAKAKVTLLLWELDYRKWEAARDPAETPIIHELLLRTGQRESDPLLKEMYARGAGALVSGDDGRWQEWRRRHKKRFDAVLSEVEDPIESKRVLKIAGERYPRGARKRTRERYERLRDELGYAFIEGRVDREASVRQWGKRRIDRLSKNETVDVVHLLRARSADHGNDRHGVRPGRRT